MQETEKTSNKDISHVLAYCKQSLRLIRHTPRVMYIPQMIHVKHIIGQYLSDIGKLYIYLLLLLLGRYFSWQILVSKDIIRPIVSALSSLDRAHLIDINCFIIAINSVAYLWFLVYNAPFNNISVKAQWYVLLMEETIVHGEIHRPAVTH